MMHYHHLTTKQRYFIEIMHYYKFKNKEIAEYIGVHPSTITNEIKRNANNDIYNTNVANMKYKNRRKKCIKDKKINNSDLINYIIDKLKLYWSPEQISGRIKIDFPNNSKMRISHESIYQYIIQDKKSGGKLFKYLRCNKKYRKRVKNKRFIIKDRNFIDNRPDIINNKLELGHWEGDLFEGKGKSGYINTYVERVSQYIIANKMNNKRSETLNMVTISGFNKIDKNHIKSITYDNGIEMSKHKELSCKLKIPIFFAHPYTPWERGLNEYSNKLLRQFFPKKTKFDNICQKEIDKIIELLNNRPRKTLNYQTPYEVLIKNKIALQS